MVRLPRGGGGGEIERLGVVVARDRGDVRPADARWGYAENRRLEMRDVAAKRFSGA